MQWQANCPHCRLTYAPRRSVRYAASTNRTNDLSWTALSRYGSIVLHCNTVLCDHCLPTPSTSFLPRSKKAQRNKMVKEPDGKNMARMLAVLHTARNTAERLYPIMKRPKAHPGQDGAHHHCQIETASPVRSAQCTFRKNVVLEEMKGRPRYREGHRHGDRESHCEVRSSSDPFCCSLRYPWKWKEDGESCP